MLIQVKPVTRKQIGEAIRILRFKTYVYEMEAEDDLVFKMVNAVRYRCAMTPMTRDDFDQRMYMYGIFNDNYNEAMEEFKCLCAGDW